MAAGQGGLGRDTRPGATRDFRFSFNVFGLTTRQAFASTCREAERYGYDTVFAADHLGLPAPFPLLVAAAEATERMRVGILVLNAGFWNPACSRGRWPRPTSSPAGGWRSAWARVT